MPRKRATPPQEPPAVLTAYVDTAGKVLLVVAVLRGKARVFATERRPPFRQKGDPPPAPSAEKRAEEWAKELAASGIEWRVPREVGLVGGQPALDTAMMALQLDLAWQREQRERLQKRKRSA